MLKPGGDEISEYLRKNLELERIAEERYESGEAPRFYFEVTANRDELYEWCKSHCARVEVVPRRSGQGFLIATRAWEKSVIAAYTGDILVWVGRKFENRGVNGDRSID